MEARQRQSLAVVITLTMAAGPLYAQTPAGTAFTYQGQLKQAGVPVDDTADLTFSLWNDPNSADPNDQVGTTITVANASIVRGLFTVQLDFGQDVFTGEARWLAIGVRVPHDPTDTLPYTDLAPRQELTPTAYALALPGLRTQQNAMCPNLIGGHSGNTVVAGVVGATIGGGGPTDPNDPNTFNRVTDDYSVVGGGSHNLAGSDDGNPSNARHVTIGGGLGNTASEDGATVGGGWSNAADGGLSSIAGGIGNAASAGYAAIGGGWMNAASDLEATVSGGAYNTASGRASSIGGGYENSASGDHATVGGGTENTTTALYATAGGGYQNSASAIGATVPGGTQNTAAGSRSFAAGTRAQANHANAFVWNGNPFVDFASTGDKQFLIWAGGGVGIGTNAPSSSLTVNGMIESLVGGFKFPDGTLQSTASVTTPSWNLTGNAGTNPNSHFLGTTDEVPLELRVNNQRALRLEQTDSSPNLIGGHCENSVTAGVLAATISGGGLGSAYANRVTDNFGTIGGGLSNQAGDDAGSIDDAWSATVAGGSENSASDAATAVGGGYQNRASGTYATVGGGRQNEASEYAATVGGGRQNMATGSLAAIAGGDSNAASGYGAAIPGGSANVAAGQFSFAAGRRAQADHDGTFVWADSTDADFASTGTDQFLIRATGGVGIGTDQPQAALDVAGAARVEVLEILGADVAERFPVGEEVKPGMLVAIDPQHPGRLCLARGAYNRCVAGVVSGANDLPTGAVLGNLPGHEDTLPVALSGRVWCWCDTERTGPIQPGDMLTTADTPGHAMKVGDHTRAHGAVIGKAMTGLEDGRGLVLVLVSLQ